MQVKQIIPAFYSQDKPLSKPETEPFLEIAEFFCDTIQGEGVSTGQPSTFLRMKGCTQSCIWCDTKEVWRFGNPFTFGEIFQLMETHNVPNKLKNGQNLILTGGSPLRQQNALYLFLEAFIVRYDFKPFIQIENECTIMPTHDMIEMVDLWNNSPKLTNSGNPTSIRYRKDILSLLSSLPNSWFKFVVSNEGEWNEIEEFYLKPGLIEKSQVILMPKGATREELFVNREIVVDMAIKHSVRYCSREHIVIWDKKTGI